MGYSIPRIQYGSDLFTLILSCESDKKMLLNVTGKKHEKYILYYTYPDNLADTIGSWNLQTEQIFDLTSPDMHCGTRCKSTNHRVGHIRCDETEVE